MTLRSGVLGWYAGAVIVAGLAALVGALGQWGQVDVGPWELGLFLALAAVMDVMVIPIAGGGGVAASFAVLFAGLLVLGPATTACVAALAGLWSEGVVRRRPAVRIGFNVGHAVLSLMAAGWVYGKCGGRHEWLESGNWNGMMAAVAAACVLWVLEAGWVGVAVGLERGGGIWRRVRSLLRPMGILEGALASVGLLLALLYQSRHELLDSSSWHGSLVLATMVLLPCALLYYAYRLQGELQDVYGQSLRTLGALVEAKVEGGQSGHGEQVARLAASLAEAIDLPSDQVRQVRYAGYLHDIGKVGVPSELLSRMEERYRGDPEPVRLHPEMGEEILRPIRFLGPAARMVRSHHERWDGLGYPEGLRQHEIPLGARLLTVANAYVGMTRTASPQLTPAQAVGRIRQASGSRFDPELVETLAHVVQRADAIPDMSGSVAELAVR
jgi:hypothetical protein